jgi:hypothetical protein
VCGYVLFCVFLCSLVVCVRVMITTARKNYACVR